MYRTYSSGYFQGLSMLGGLNVGLIVAITNKVHSSLLTSCLVNPLIVVWVIWDILVGMILRRRL